MKSHHRSLQSGDKKMKWANVKDIISVKTDQLDNIIKNCKFQSHYIDGGLMSKKLYLLDFSKHMCVKSTQRFGW